jgi:long-chain acyl-CoA synthetase
MLEPMFGCFKAGIGAVPFNFRLHPKEFAFIIDHSEFRAVIISPEFNEGMLGIRDRIPGATHIITITGAHGELLDYEELTQQESDHWGDASVNPDDLAWLFYTSGTTRLPKGAMLTHRNLLAMTRNVYADICPGFGPDDAILHAAPLCRGLR